METIEPVLVVYDLDRASSSKPLFDKTCWMLYGPVVMSMMYVCRKKECKGEIFHTGRAEGRPQEI